MPTYSIITPTGDRPRTLSICSQLVCCQSVSPKEWIVVDDGETSSNTEELQQNPHLCYIRRKRKKTDPKHTLPLNLFKALEYVTSDYVFIFEDDDYYSTSYCESLLPLFEEADLVGHDPTIYYHVPFSLYLVLPYRTNISLFCTGFSRDIFDTLLENADTSSPFLDRTLWSLPVKKKFHAFSKPLCVGLKGLPGRPGQTAGHKQHIYATQRAVPDTNRIKLQEWMGEDYDLYKEFV